MEKEGWTSNQLDLCLNYLDPEGRRHNLFASAAEEVGKVTFCSSFLRRLTLLNRGTIRDLGLDKKMPPPRVNETLFKEILIAPPQLSAKVSRYAQSLTMWIEEKPVLETLIKILERDWDSDKIHICFHSSGYDSRILSGALMKLREKNGRGWIGRILFLCWEPEGELFRDVMKWEGWKERDFHIYREGVSVDYRSELVDFENVWRWVNGCSPPSHPFGPAVEEAKLRLPAEEIYMISAYGDQLYEWNKVLRKRSAEFNSRGYHLGSGGDYRNPLAAQILYNIYYSFNTAPMFSAVEHEGFKFPYYDIEILSSWKDKRSIVKQISPELDALPKFPEKTAQEYPYWIKSDGRLSKETREKIAKDFSDSWLAKTTRRGIDLAPEFGEKSLRWWTIYVVASICQRLIDWDVKIRIT